MAADSIVETHTFKAHDLKIASVIVYVDRAEVKRTLKATLKPGVNQVLIENISWKANSDSIVVDGRGDAVIHEVQVKDQPTLPDESSSPRVQELRKEVKKLEEERKVVEDRKKVVGKRMEILDGIVGKAGESLLCRKNGENVAVDDETLENISKLVNYHEHGHTGALEKIRELDDEMRQIEEQIRKINEQINQTQHNNTRNKVICIILESKDGGDVEVDVSYQMGSASWHPAYEIRVQSATNTLKLSYFGQIAQSTGEDWVDTSLILSTARPSLGGMTPRLGTLNAEFYKPEPPHVYRPMPRMMAASAVNFESMDYEEEEEMGFAGASPMGHAPVDVRETSMSTMFLIARPTTVPSDSSEHRVTIATLDLSPKMFYETVPSKNINVYLTASVLNESGKPLLPGEASVYFDNSFIAKSQIKAVFPGERFQCSLGVDPSVKVEYKPVQKYTEQGGLLARTVSTMNEQKIIIKNTKSTSILITVREHVPKSTDEKIKIKLISPELDKKDGNERGGNTTEPTVGIRLDANHNLEWTKNIDASQEEQLSVKWSMEHPSGQNVTFQEVFPHGNLD